MDNKSPSLLLWRVTLTALSFASLVFAIWASTYWERLTPAKAGTLAATFSEQDVENRRIILAMAPDSPLARAGAKVGDRVKPDHSVELPRHYFGTDETVGLTLQTGDRNTHLLLQPVPNKEVQHQAAAAETNVALIIAVGFLAIAIGTLIGWRRGESRAMRALALVFLISIGVDSFRLLVPIGTTLDIYYRTVNPIQFSLGYVLFLFFTLIYPEDRPIWRYRRVRAAFYVYLGCFVIHTACKAAVAFDVFPRQLTFSDRSLIADCAVVLVGASVLPSLLALAFSWWQATGIARKRLGWIGLCIGSIYASWLGLNLAYNLGLSFTVIEIEGANMVIVSLSLLGFGYALLRHRLFDFGLAVNRALVFTIISSMLLVVFSISEWAVDKLLHFEGREKNAMFDALVALGVILSFHRIQHWVKHRVDHTFFHHWHRAAEKFRHFLDKTAHISHPSALQEKFMHAVLEFCGAQGAAIYACEASGNYHRQLSTLDGAPASIDANDDLVIDLMHGAGSVDFDAGSRICTAELAFPMMVRGRLNGLVLLGPRRSGDKFRPDQITLLKSAVHQFGLDIESLRVEAMERRASESERIAESMKGENEALRHHVHDLRANNENLLAANEGLRALVGDGKLTVAGLL